MWKPLLAVATLLSLFVMSCRTVPITGRQQLALVPSSTILSMSFDSYRKFLSEHTVIKGTADAWMVQDVGVRVQKAVERYFAQRNMPDQLQGYSWEFHLVEGKEMNAWCMPGGKVVVYTGILPVTKDETGLAAVMGHEIAHAVLSAYGAGATIGVLLPYNRLHESEADRLGLIFMAMAAYDPHAAVDFWKRMEAGKKGKIVPEFLSTHPADKTRIENIGRLLPEAMQYYRP
jgi:predicted Zn-dependent protease